MSAPYPRSAFLLSDDVTSAIAGSPRGRWLALDAVVDEDFGRSNPMLGFLIAFPLGLLIWAVMIGIGYLVWSAISA